MTDEGLPPDLLETFVGELREQVEAMNRDLLALERDPGAEGALDALFRAAHTVKGAARVVGVRPVETLCHAMESYLAEVRGGRLALAEDRMPLLFQAADVLDAAADRLAAGEEPDPGPATTVAAGFSELVARGRGDRPRRADGGEGPSRPAAPDEEPRGAEAARGEPTAASAGDGGGSTTVADGSGASGAERDRDGADELGAGPGKASVQGASEGGLQAADGAREVRVSVEAVDGLFAPLGALGSIEDGLSRAVRDAEDLRASFDRWTRRWAEVVPLIRTAERGQGDTTPGTALGLEEELLTLREGTGALARSVRRCGLAVERVTGDLYETVQELRLRPVADAFSALPRAARDVARDEGKRVEVHLDGGGMEADRAVIDALREPLLHLVRNAVDHGIEAPAVREAAGKDPVGSVTVQAERRGGRLRIAVTDDGDGLDPEAVREHLGEDGRRLSDAEAVRALFRGGVSTRSEATEISGRGVGLDVVRERMDSIRGRVDVSWSRGQGTTFTLEFPPSPSTLRVLLVEVDGDLFGLPLVDVEALTHVPRAAVKSVAGRPVIQHDGLVPLLSLADLLGPPLAPAGEPDVLQVVLLAAAEGRLAVGVDRVLRDVEVVVRPIRGRGTRRPWLFGGAVLPDGAVAVVLDGRAVLDTGLRGDAARTTSFQADPDAPDRVPRVLVVDDSLTTRALEQSVLESAGYRVATAVDGRDAWRRLQEEAFDLVVSDVEMPGEDGLALCRRIRASGPLAHLPVVLVTGLEKEGQREAGLEAGASAYVGKSTFERGDFLEIVQRLLGEGA